jgi:hypothetical protein
MVVATPLLSTTRGFSPTHNIQTSDINSKGSTKPSGSNRQNKNKLNN